MLTSRDINMVIEKINQIERDAARLAFYPENEPDADVFKYRRLVDIGSTCKELRSQLMDEFVNLMYSDEAKEIPEDI